MPTPKAVQARQRDAQEAAKTYLGRGIIRDNRPQDRGQRRARGAFAKLLSLARRVREQAATSARAKVYSLHAPEVEMAFGKASPSALTSRRQGSVATPLRHCKGEPVRPPM